MLLRKGCYRAVRLSIYRTIHVCNRDYERHHHRYRVNVISVLFQVLLFLILYKLVKCCNLTLFRVCRKGFCFESASLLRYKRTDFCVKISACAWQTLGNRKKPKATLMLSYLNVLNRFSSLLKPILNFMRTFLKL